MACNNFMSYILRYELCTDAHLPACPRVIPARPFAPLSLPLCRPFARPFLFPACVLGVAAAAVQAHACVPMTIQPTRSPVPQTDCPSA
eukprot:365431-Chlamydomonas_euryale.AAC.16